MALLREYCLNDKPVQIELLSDPDEGKASGYSYAALFYGCYVREAKLVCTSDSQQSTTKIPI